MANTVDQRTLRTRFKEVFGFECELNTKEIMDRWASTREGNATGANVTPKMLEQRIDKTLQLMLP
jgi:hypothetical protein